MKNTLLFISLIFLCIQCNSQKNENNLKPKLENPSSKIADENYFIGSWKNTKTYHTMNGKKELQPQIECSEKSYWKFTKDKEILKQSKFTATGENCERFISTTFGTVNLDNQQMNYFVNDVLYSVKISIVSDDEFTLTTRDFIAGKMIQVEETFEKIK